MKFSKLYVGLTILSLASAARAVPIPFIEGFNNLSAWTLINNSSIAGNSWFQGNAGVFESQSGAPDSYAAADFLSASGPIDNWLISPELTLGSDILLSFYTGAVVDAGFHDSLQVLFSVGASTALAGFNALLTIGADPLIDYPSFWTAFSTLLPNAASGRVAFRYFGDSSTSNYVGIDSVRVVPAPPTSLLFGLGVFVLAMMRRPRRMSGRSPAQ